MQHLVKSFPSAVFVVVSCQIPPLLYPALTEECSGLFSTLLQPRFHGARQTCGENTFN